MTIGGAGMYSMGVALPLVQADFSATRGDASLPYTLTMIGFGIGGILMGRLADRFGIVVPVMIGALGLGAGFVLAGTAALCSSASPTACQSGCSAARLRSRRSSPTLRSGSTGAAGSRWRSARAATI